MCSKRGFPFRPGRKVCSERKGLALGKGLRIENVETQRMVRKKGLNPLGK